MPGKSTSKLDIIGGMAIICFFLISVFSLFFWTIFREDAWRNIFLACLAFYLLYCVATYLHAVWLGKRLWWIEFVGITIFLCLVLPCAGALILIGNKYNWPGWLIAISVGAAAGTCHGASDFVERRLNNRFLSPT